ncbi:MAG: leucine-rich repeat domain-containing protein [Saprospiraceae bacterium]|nr:leucine-rich repeat domain-containing protein [Saprospiraceae bacterium]
MKLNSKEQQNLLQLLGSNLPDNLHIAFNILSNLDGEQLQPFVYELFVLHALALEQTHGPNDLKLDKELSSMLFLKGRTVTTCLLQKIPNPAIHKSLDRNYRNYILWDIRYPKKLEKIATGLQLNPLPLAQAFYKKTGLCLNYLLENIEDETIICPIIESFIYNDNLILEGKHLRFFPKILFKYTKLESINLNDNHIAKIPKEIENFTNLKHLFIRRNMLTNIHPNIQKLKKLRYIDLYSSSRQYVDFDLPTKALLEQLNHIHLNYYLNLPKGAPHPPTYEGV